MEYLVMELFIFTINHPHISKLEFMDELSIKIRQSLAHEELRAERLANQVRVVLISIMLIVALLSMRSLGREANWMNFSVIGGVYLYGAAVFIITRRSGYKPFMKYATSFIDILMVHVLLFLYTLIEIPSVALKNYVFLVVYPLLLLCVFRFDWKLTLSAGIWALALYIGLFAYLLETHRVTVFLLGGYSMELFSSEITWVGQITKMVILAGYTALASYLARYSRMVMERTIRNEVTQRVEKESIVRELEVASQVQRLLLPGEMPQVGLLDAFGTVRPGRFVGGDYYDFIRLSTTSLLAVIADVSGHGVPAALIMSEVRAATHLLASMDIPLEEFIARLNTLTLRSTSRDMYVTYFIACIDTSTNTIRYINAGHPPGYILSAGMVCPLSDRTFALGSIEKLPQLAARSAGFPPGSLFIACTDGILEHANPFEEQYGEQRLQQFILARPERSAEQTARELLEELKAFGGGREFNDDATVVVVKNTPAHE